MTEAMPFLQKTILLSYDPRPLWQGAIYDQCRSCFKSSSGVVMGAMPKFSTR